MYRVAVSIVGCPALAEDVVQEAVINVWDGLPSYRAEAPIRNWVLRITHNAAVGTLRRLRDESWDPSMLPDVAVSGQVERTAEARDELARLRDALSGLDDLSRRIVVLRELEGMSYVDIADALDVSLGQVKIRLFRARRRLRDEVQASPPRPRRED